MEERTQEWKGLFTAGVYLVIGMEQYPESYAAIHLGWKVQTQEIKVELWAKMGIEEAGKARGVTRVEEEMKEKLIAIGVGSTFWVAWLKNEGGGGEVVGNWEESQSGTTWWEQSTYGLTRVGEKRSENQTRQPANIKVTADEEWEMKTWGCARGRRCISMESRLHT